MRRTMFADQGFVVGKFSFFHVVAEQIAQHTAEILMPWKRHEGTGVGNHAHKTRKQTGI